MGGTEEFQAAAAEAGFEHDPEIAEEYAEAVGTDPTHDQINSYLALAGEDPLHGVADDQAAEQG